MKFIFSAGAAHCMLAGSLFACSFSLPAVAQEAAPAPLLQSQAVLPEAPGSMISASIAAPDPLTGAQATGAGGPVAPKWHRVIQPGQTAQPLSAGDKLTLSIRGRLSLTSLASSLLSAGWGQLTTDRPHYGSDSGAFGERLGASALSGTTHSLFSYGIYAAAFHQDPRYYVMGDGHGLVKRAIYSASRTVLVGGPGDHMSVNWSNIAGTASSTALANTYYPPQDRRVGATVESFATSFATQAAGNELDEFLGDVLRRVRHKK